MNESKFAEFQYFIKRIKHARNGGSLNNGETLEDLEQRFRKQVENGLVIIDPGPQEIAMDILLSGMSEENMDSQLTQLRRTGKCSFTLKEEFSNKLKSHNNPEKDMERALNLIIKALNVSGLRVQRQPLAVKMLEAAHNMSGFDFCDPDDLKLLFVKTIKRSGHVKKANPLELARIFNNLIPLR